MSNYRKRVLQDALAALEEETEKNNVKEGAQVRLSGILMRAYNNSEETKDRHVAEYLTQQMITWPHTIEFLTPEFSKTLARDPNFLTGLLIAKRASSATRLRIIATASRPAAIFPRPRANVATLQR